MSGIDYLKLGLKIEKLNIKTFADLKKQMLGIDTSFLRDLTDKLGGEDYADKAYDFDKAMELIEEHMNSKMTEFGEVSEN